MTSGRKLTAVILIAGFALILGTAASAEPLEAENAAASHAAAAAKTSGPVRHFVGLVTEISGSTLTLNSGTRKLTIDTASSTIFESYLAGGKIAGSLNVIGVGDRVAALGPISGSTMTARLVALLPTHTPKRHADTGVVTAVTAKSVSFTSNSKGNSAGVFNYTETTVFTEKAGGKIEKVASTALQVGDRISFVGSVDSTGIITAKLVHIIPGH